MEIIKETALLNRMQSERVLSELIKEKFQIFADRDPEHECRLQEEMLFIRENDWSRLYLLTYEFVKSLPRNTVFNMRDVGAGSFVAHIMGMTKADPCSLRIPVEIFHNKERVPSFCLNVPGEEFNLVIRNLKKLLPSGSFREKRDHYRIKSSDWCIKLEFRLHTEHKEGDSLFFDWHRGNADELSVTVYDERDNADNEHMCTFKIYFCRNSDLDQLDSMRILSNGLTIPEKIWETPEVRDMLCNEDFVGIPTLGSVFYKKTLQPYLNIAGLSDMIRVEGLTKGCDVWCLNGKNLVDDGKLSVSEIIACREDVYELLYDKVGTEKCFDLMNRISKGEYNSEIDEFLRKRGVTEDQRVNLRGIGFLFNRSHAAEYAWLNYCFLYFKKITPELFYHTSLIKNNMAIKQARRWKLPLDCLYEEREMIIQEMKEKYMC